LGFYDDEMNPQDLTDENYFPIVPPFFKFRKNN
jgi:hypothetical protein